MLNGYVLVGYVLVGYVLVGYVLNGYVWCEICVGYVWCEICVGYVWCEIRQQSSEEPCDETSFGKKQYHSGLTMRMIFGFTLPQKIKNHNGKTSMNDVAPTDKW